MWEDSGGVTERATHKQSKQWQYARKSKTGDKDMSRLNGFNFIFAAFLAVLIGCDDNNGGSSDSEVVESAQTAAEHAEEAADHARQAAEAAEQLTLEPTDPKERAAERAVGAAESAERAAEAASRAAEKAAEKAGEVEESEGF
jgi:hypothetical protein